MVKSKGKQTVYRVSFVNQGKIYEVYTKTVSSSALFGFIEMGELIFGEASTLVIDPSEENLRREFKGVTSVHIPMHNILRIDTMKERGTAKITSISDSNVSSLRSSPIYTQKPGE